MLCVTLVVKSQPTNIRNNHTIQKHSMMYVHAAQIHIHTTAKDSL